MIVFLDRPLEDLLPTEDRPLSNNAEKLRKLHKTRYPIYLAAADKHVSVHGTPEDTLKKLLRVV